MSHLTSHSPATSVLKVRIWGHSGKGPVTSLPRGSLIATYLYYPNNYNPAYHSPVLAGVPDGWSFENADQLQKFTARLLSSGGNNKLGAGGELNNIDGPTGAHGAGLDEPSIRMQKTFVPLVLAEDVTVRKSSPNAAWADTYVSAALSGVTELHGKWCTGAGCNSGLPGIMFQGGEEFWVYLKFVGPKQHCILSAHPDVAARRGCLESYRQICKPLGEFVHPPLRLAFELDKPELISGVYIDPLVSRELRKKAGVLTTTYTRQLLTGNSGTNKVLSDDELVVLWKNSFDVDAAADSIDNQAKFDAVQKGVLGLANRVAAYAKALKVDDATYVAPFKTAIAAFETETFNTTTPATNDATVKTLATASNAIRAELLNKIKALPGFAIKARAVTGNIVKDDVRLGDNVPSFVFDYFGSRTKTAETAPADQSAALSGHGTTLIKTTP
jgi:hypothetical protein